MTTSVLSIAISGITPADQGAMAEAARRWDSIAKPIGGLGLLEEAVIRAAGVQGPRMSVWTERRWPSSAQITV